MTARDEAIAAMNTAKWGDPRQRMYEDFGRLLDLIPGEVLARLAIERGGLVEVEILDEIGCGSEVVDRGTYDEVGGQAKLYRLVTDES